MKLHAILLFLAFPAFALSDDPRVTTPGPQKKFIEPPVQPPAIVSDGSKNLSGGKIKILKLVNYDKPVTWKVIQSDPLVECATAPKGSKIFGTEQGSDKFAKHVFDREVLILYATGEGNGTVKVQAMVAEKAAFAEKVVAEITIEVKP